MRFQLVITDEAEADIRDAFRWYDEQQAGLGARFVDAIGQRLAFIEQQALAITIVDHDIRRAVVSRFPYHIYFTVNGRHANILAVWHGRRDSSALTSRR
jgi:plasmid stabilization system protein ParE